MPRITTKNASGAKKTSKNSENSFQEAEKIPVRDGPSIKTKSSSNSDQSASDGNETQLSKKLKEFSDKLKRSSDTYDLWSKFKAIIRMRNFNFEEI